MLDLAEIPFFNSLSAESLEYLRERVPVKHYPQGSIIVRVGDVGKNFQAIADGAVWVQTSDRSSLKDRGVLLGPGQVFGEMSLFSGAPISNTLVATKDTACYCISGEDFLALLEREPSVHRNLTKILIDRLRKQTQSDVSSPGLIILAYQANSEASARFSEVVKRAILHYAPGSEIYAGKHGEFDPVLPSRIVRWRESAPGQQFLTLAIRPIDLANLQDVMEPKDVVLQISDVTEGAENTHMMHLQSGVADFARVFIGSPPEQDPNPWAYKVSEVELKHATRKTKRWDAGENPTISRIARFLTHKEIGIAMSSGAARGFAHLGVLDELEKAQIPIDALSGSSMGGIVALTLARKGNVGAAIRQVQEQLGANKKIRDRALIPRGSIFTGAKIAQAAESTFGDCTFADLSLPVSVVAADIAGGERVIIDRGSVKNAVLATSAIPGFFPPIEHNNRLMVDGGVVSWVPVDVLSHRRCGLRIAINVLPLSENSQQDIVEGFQRMGEKLRRPLGLKAVLGSSWELLGSWGSTRETLAAEVVITPSTPTRAGYDFDQFETLVECGRSSAVDRIEAIAELVSNTLHS